MLRRLQAISADRYIPTLDMFSPYSANTHLSRENPSASRQHVPIVSVGRGPMTRSRRLIKTLTRKSASKRKQCALAPAKVNWKQKCFQIQLVMFIATTMEFSDRGLLERVLSSVLASVKATRRPEPVPLRPGRFAEHLVAELEFFFLGR